MAANTDYGTDIAALTDLPDPEVLVSGELNAAYANGRRLLTPTGALEEIGDLEEYDCVDVRDWVGTRQPNDDVSDYEATATQVLTADERNLTAIVDITITDGALTLTGSIVGTDGPFPFVLGVDDVNAQVLEED